ncbi:amidase [Halopolyspora algeriensis]|uniref:Amidase n=1 Tax=Halopolyspora algeriensis TaxID=1500506 RepID=A0A368VH79_9ACTN|nr:amidase [Halopolyspora algeriensis]RCW40473.1 amidase [Halopolyspora algeriensis]TQM53756.1 amidase [Halopolyspora algeriensis]
MEYSEYRKHDGVALAERIRSGEVSAGEVLEAAIARAEVVNDRINALTRTCYDEARKQAAEELSGPLAGVPFLLKDLHQEYAGAFSTAGSQALQGVPAPETAEVVRRWTEAGLVVFGRTNTPEFGAKPITEPLVSGAARNPWNLAHTPGGSSGGAAAAVASGIVPVAGASDGGGSIRIPAACCGLFGLKPGRGLVPAGPERAENFHGASLDGVISRSVRDSAAALDVLIGPDPEGPYQAGVPEREFTQELSREPGTLRIGFSAESALGDPHPHAVAALTDAAELLESLGHEVEEVSSPVDLAALAVDFLEAWSVKLASAMNEAIRRTGASESSFELDTRLLAAVGRTFSGPEYSAVLDRWHGHTRRLAEFHRQYDLLLTPSLAGPPVRIGELETPGLLQEAGKLALRLRLAPVLRATGVVDRVARDNLRHVPYTQLANITGRPAMSVPLYWDPEGLPLGVQFVAPLGGEGMLFRLAAQLEQARAWADHEPPL